MKRFATVFLLLIAPTWSASASNPSASSVTLPHETWYAPSIISVDTPHADSLTYDTVWNNWNLHHSTKTESFIQGHLPHTLMLTQIERASEVPYIENLPFLGFNRVTGFYLGIGSPTFSDLGPHDEVGILGGAGYGFADKRWEYRFGSELRLPLSKYHKVESDTTRMRHFFIPSTLAIGGEIHNVTSTDDAWRAGQLENTAYSFFAREDFRDYYKLAGWDAYLAYRPNSRVELRLDWRSDHYQSLSQEVYYGRWGGNKVLPVNPPVTEGRMNSLAVSLQHETTHTRSRTVENVFGDPVNIEQLSGNSSLVQSEFGHMPGSDLGFNRYLVDARHFVPLTAGVNFDTRFRFEATTGDMLPQKLEYLGGPGSLPALYNKSLVGNRMLLLNTELRLNLAMLSTVFHSPDLNLVVYNDIAKLGIAGDGVSIFKGYQFSGASSILYNVGVGIGWTNGIQAGVTWPTNVKDDPRVIFRLNRAF